ncbi:MAG: isocitrate lyase/PEP mutase family protein [Gemmiger sp.]|nr:isocitrate lyase/PEP mutase family protein [Gemmiger sp.]
MIPYILTTEKKVSAAARLRGLLRDKKVRIVPELYDCLSAKAAEMNGFEVIMVSSGDLACGMTGIPDLQLLSIDDFVRATEQITRMTPMPLIIDADDGFGLGRALNAQYGCMRIMQAGAAGVLVTDTAELGRKGQLSIPDACLRFAAARAGLDANGMDGFLIGRCDSNLEAELDETVARCKAYIDAGVDMLCILWMHKIPGREKKLALCRQLKAGLDALGGKYVDFPMWYPDLCGKAHDPGEVTMQDLAELESYKLVGVHYSAHAAMLAMLDVGRHILKEQNNDYVDHHFDDTGYKTFTTMSMFGLTDNAWVEAENAFVREPQDSVAQRNADYFVKPDDVHNPDEK